MIKQTLYYQQRLKHCKCRMRIRKLTKHVPVENHHPNPPAACLAVNFTCTMHTTINYVFIMPGKPENVEVPVKRWICLPKNNTLQTSHHNGKWLVFITNTHHLPYLLQIVKRPSQKFALYIVNSYKQRTK